MKTLDVKDFKLINLRDVMRGDRITITHRGKELFSIISMHDFYLLEAQQFEDLAEGGDFFSISDLK